MNDELTAWAPRVYRFALRLTGNAHAAEDLTQETLLRAWDRRGQLRDTLTLRVWLFRIAANAWRDQLRRQRWRRGVTLTIEPASPVKPVEELAEQREELELALAALDALPDRQREVLYLNACEELPLEAIADILGISPSAAKASLSLARKKIRQLLPDVLPEPR